MNDEKQTAQQVREKAIESIKPISGLFVQIQRQMASVDPVELAGKLHGDEIADICTALRLVTETIARATSRDISKVNQVKRIYGR